MEKSLFIGKWMQMVLGLDETLFARRQRRVDMRWSGGAAWGRHHATTIMITNTNDNVRGVGFGASLGFLIDCEHRRAICFGCCEGEWSFQ